MPTFTAATRRTGFRLFAGERVSPAHYFSPSSSDWYGWYPRYPLPDDAVHAVPLTAAELNG